MAGQLIDGKDINPYTGEIVEGRYDPATDSIVRPGKPAIPLNGGSGGRNDMRESGGIPQKGTDMGGGLAAFDLSAAESWLGGPMKDPFNSSPLPGSPDSMHQYAALNDESNNLGGFGDDVEVNFRSNVDPGTYSEFNATEGLTRTDIPQDIFPVDLKNTEMKPTAQSEGGYQPDLARRAAFLNAKDSMSGMKAVNRHMGTVVNAGNHYIRKGDELVGISRDQYRDYMRGDVGAQALLKDTIKAVNEGGAETPASRTQIPNFPQQNSGFETPGLKSNVDINTEDFTRSNAIPKDMDYDVPSQMAPIETPGRFFE